MTLCRKEEKRASRAEFALGWLPRVSDRGLTRPPTQHPAHRCSWGRRGRVGNKRGRRERGWRGREAAERGLGHVWRGTHQVLAMGHLWRVASAGSRDDSQVFWISALRVWWEPRWGWGSLAGIADGMPSTLLSLHL